MVNLAVEYIKGSEVTEINIEKANALIEKAVALGNSNAQLILGDSYLYARYGYNSERDKAIGLYNLSAAQKNEKAFFRLGDLYSQEFYGIKKDRLKVAINCIF